MVNRVAGCQPPVGATPLLGFGLPPLPGVVAKVLASGSASWKHPFCVLCVRMALVVLCGGCGVGVFLCCAVCCAVLPLYSRAPLVCTVLRCSSVCLRQLCVPKRCAILCCSGVCCAAVFRRAPLSALACCNALCAVLHQQRMAATATWATATLFHGGQVSATSEALRCRHTPVGGAVSKHPAQGQPMRIMRISHLISSHLMCSPPSALWASVLRRPMLLSCVLRCVAPCV